MGLDGIVLGGLVVFCGKFAGLEWFARIGAKMSDPFNIPFLKCSDGFS